MGVRGLRIFTKVLNTPALMLPLLLGAGAGLEFLFTLSISRQLSPEEAGKFFLVLSISMATAYISLSGSERPLIRFVAIMMEGGRGSDIRALYRKVTFTVLSIASIESATLYYLFAGGFLTSYGFVFGGSGSGILILMIPFLAYVRLNSSMLQGLGKAVASSIFSNVLLYLLYFILFAVSSIGYGYSPQLFGMGVILIISSVLVAVLVLATWRRLSKGLPKQGTLDDSYTQVVAASKPLFLSSIIEQGMLWGAPILTGFLSSSEEVAYFGVSSRISLLVVLVLVAVNRYFSPHFAILYSQGELPKLRELVHQIGGKLFWIGGLIAALTIIFGKQLLSLFGDSYIQAYSILVVLVCGQFINLATGSVGILLIMTGRESLYRNFQIVGACCLVVFIYLFTPTFGAWGTAVAVSLSIGVQNMMSVIAVRKYLGFYSFSLRW